MPEHFNCRCTDIPPPGRGIRVRLVGGDLHGQIREVPNLDDHVNIFVPFADENGYWELMYQRVFDPAGVRYLYVHAVPDLGPRKKAVD